MNGSINGNHFQMRDTILNIDLSFYSSSIDVSTVREDAEENSVELFVEVYAFDVS